MKSQYTITAITGVVVLFLGFWVAFLISHSVDLYFPERDLPIVPGHSYNYPPHTNLLVIEISAKEEMTIRGVPRSLSQLSELLQSLAEIVGCDQIAIHIAADSDTRWKAICPVITCARDTGYWKVKFVVSEDLSQEYVGTLDAMIKSFLKPEDKGVTEVELKVDHTGFWLNSVKSNSGELRHDLGRLLKGLQDKHYFIRLVPELDAEHDKVMEALGACEDIEAMNVLVVPTQESKSQQNNGEGPDMAGAKSGPSS